MDRQDSEMVLQPEDPLACKCIGKLASVVAWDPKAEFFLMQIMHGYKEFAFLNAGNPHNAYYRHRVAALRQQPSVIYAASGDDGNLVEGDKEYSD